MFSWVENVVPNHATQFRTWTSLTELYIVVNASLSDVMYDIQIFNSDGSTYVNGSGTTGEVCIRIGSYHLALTSAVADGTAVIAAALVATVAQPVQLHCDAGLGRRVQLLLWSAHLQFVFDA